MTTSVKSIPRIPLMLLLVFASASFSAQIVESGLETVGRSPVYWTSNEQVLFYGPTGEAPTEEDSFRRIVYRLTTWNLRTREIKRYGKVDVSFCYYEGFVTFVERDVTGNPRWTTSGPLDAMKREERAPIPPTKFDRTTCRSTDSLPSLPSWTKEHEIVRLRPEHGFLSLGSSLPGSSRTNSSVSFHSAASEQSVDLPIGRREASWVRLTYFPFKKAYFVDGDYFEPQRRLNISPWPKGLERPVWWIYPDGRTEQMMISPEDWMREWIVPTRAGLLAISNVFFTITGEVPHDGVYLIRSRGSSRLIRGLTRSFNVSPDGCKLALNRQPEPGVKRPEFSVLTIVDVCSGALVSREMSDA